MALHPTQSDLHLKKSVMRFVIDFLATEKGLTIFFEPIFEVPRNDAGEEISNWIEVSFAEKLNDTVSSMFLLFDIYTRRDSEGFENSKILDFVTDMLFDEDSTNGTAFIPYYDTTDDENWIPIGGIVPLHRRTTEIWPAKDSTSVRTVSYELKWGAR